MTTGVVVGLLGLLGFLVGVCARPIGNLIDALAERVRR